MELGLYNISSKRILELYGIDLQKSKALVGEIREWQGKKYKKVDNGKWVEIRQIKQGEKEREVAQSGMKKVISSEIEKHRKVVDDLISNLKKKYGKENSIDVNNIYDIVLKVKLSRFIDTHEEVIKAREEFSKIRQDLQDDLNEVESLLQQQNKLKREEKAGKKEIDTNSDSYKQLITQIRDYDKILNEIPSSVTPSEALGSSVTTDNYWLNTDALFRTVYEYSPEDANIEDVWKDPVKRKWEELKKNKDLEHTFSPKSSSEYLVNRETGDVYRMADHWGRCASCFWDCDMREREYGIAKCNVKDFERNDRNSYYNPEKIKAIFSISTEKLDLLKNLIENDKQYFDKTTTSILQQQISRIRMDLGSVYHNNDEQVKKLREEYKAIFEFEFKR